MHKFLVATFAAFVLASTVQARDPIRDGKVQLSPAKDNRFQAAEFTFGKVELYGYIGELKDSKNITGIMLLNGEKATTEQKHIIAVTAKGQSLDAFITLDGKVQPLDDPTPNGSGTGAAAEGGAAH